MSVASLQHQFAASAVGSVELRSYFSALCESIGTSMIRDHTKLSPDIDIDGSVRIDVSRAWVCELSRYLDSVGIAPRTN